MFICLATRAVHLEVAYSLGTDSFPNAFFRMTSRRGVPRDVLSDNGTNFVGGVNELKELEALDKERIQDTTASYGVKWHFHPPFAPHFSGVHEVMIKAAKKAIYAILGCADITDEELLSAVVGAEGLINSRPLTYQSISPEDIDAKSVAFNPRRRWHRVQELVRHFWHRWTREWLPGLNKRKKWHRDQDNIQVGDVVLVMSVDTSRGRWPLGRIIKTYAGADGRVRVADVQIGKGIIKRPIVKLCPLENH